MYEEMRKEKYARIALLHCGDKKYSDKKYLERGIKMLKVVYEDGHILVCFKPAGVPVQTASIGRTDLESMVRNYLAEKTGTSVPYLGMIHRLDQPVQGLVVFAKNKKSAASLSAQVQDGRMKKYYLAVTDGLPEEKEARLIHYLKKDSRTNMSACVEKNVSGAKKAELIYRVRETNAQTAHALVEIELLTGRHHQIRVQMAANGTPLVGDTKYNVHADTRTGIGLCAYRLELLHPENGKRMEFCCEAQGSAFEEFF